MNFILFSLLVTASFAGSMCLGKGWVLSWAFNGGGYVDFTLALTADTFENYGWAGIGFKQSDDTAGMRKSDIVAFVFSEEVTDRYALGDQEPDFDVDLGGTDDVTSVTFDQSTYTYTWQKPMFSPDPCEFCDRDYIQDYEYSLLWACGQYLDGVMEKHDMTDRELILITLSDDFNSPCTDSFLALN